VHIPEKNKYPGYERFRKIEETIYLQEIKEHTMKHRFKQEAALSVSPAESPHIKGCLG